jgi:hypothetical protein
MLAIAGFWLLLALPGTLLVRRSFPALADAGLLACLPLGYVLSFALLSPLSIAGYIGHAPIALLSGGVVALLVVSSAYAARAAWQSRAGLGSRLRANLRRPGRTLELCASAVLLGDLWLSALQGTHMGGDAMFHAGRARMILQHGFNSWDPVLAGQHFVPEYHTNLYHALMAACAQLTGHETIEVWIGLFVWAKLLVVASSYYLAFMVFGQRLAGYLGAVLTAVYLGPYTVLPYPNSLASALALCVGIGLTIELFRKGPSRAVGLGLFALSLVIAQVHALYLVLLCMLIGPLLAFEVARRWRARDPGKATALLCAAALCAGLPLVWVARNPPPRPPSEAAAATSSQAPPPATVPPAAAEPAPVAAPAAPVAAPAAPVTASAPRGFRLTDSGRIMLDPEPWLSLRAPGIYLLLLLGLASLPRASLGPRLALATLGLSGLYLYVPLVCTWLVERAGAPWVLQRLNVLHSVLLNALPPGLLLAPFAARPAWLRWLAPAVFALTLFYGHVRGVDAVAWPRATYLNRYADFERQPGRTDRMLAASAVLARNVRPGATIWIDPESATMLGAVCDCYSLVLPGNFGSRGVTDMAQRRRDVMRMIDPNVALDERRALLTHYRIRQFFIARHRTLKQVVNAYRSFVLDVDKERAARVVTLRRSVFLEAPAAKAPDGR